MPPTTTQSILIIDDDPSTRETFAQMLAATGHLVCAVADVAAGLEEVARRPPAAVLLDLHMPLAGGLDCLRQLRATPRSAGLPVAILTGDYFLDDTTAQEINALGAAIYFKPIWDADLVNIVTRLVAPRMERSR